MDSETPLISKTELNDLPAVISIFEQVLKLSCRPGYRVWEVIDHTAIENDIKLGLQYKIIIGNTIACVFSIQFSDPHIWGQKDKEEAVYLHRIVTNPQFKGLHLFENVKAFATAIALQSGLKFLRMDTWADNQQLINYYLHSGFRFVGNYTTGDTLSLSLPNRNLRVALLEMPLPHSIT